MPELNPEHLQLWHASHALRLVWLTTTHQIGWTRSPVGTAYVDVRIPSRPDGDGSGTTFRLHDGHYNLWLSKLEDRHRTALSAYIRAHRARFLTDWDHRSRAFRDGPLRGPDLDEVALSLFAILEPIQPATPNREVVGGG
jgi:hypothetical protein